MSDLARHADTGDAFESIWVYDHYRRIVPANVDELMQQLRNGPLVGTPEQIIDKLTRMRGPGPGLRDHLLPRRDVRPFRS